MEQYPSVLLEKAVGEFSKLPGIGRKTASPGALRASPACLIGRGLCFGH